MKKVIFGLTVLFGAVILHAQTPYLQFANNATSLVTIASSGQTVRASNGVVVALYGAPDGVTDENQLVPIVSTNAGFTAAPGRFSAGLVTGPSFSCGGYIMIQYRAFEKAYGNTYEAAIAAGPMNGRYAMVGKSGVGRIALMCAPNPYHPTSEALGAFTVDSSTLNPLFNVNDIVVSEGSNGLAIATFTVELTGSSNATRSVDFATADGTAVAGSDYVSTNGTLTFAPGESSKAVAVTLTPDVPVESDEDFFLQLSNPVNGVIGRSQGRCIITEVRVLGLRVDTVVTFNTVNGHTYAVEKSADLNNWTTVTGASNVLGTGSSASIVDAGSGCSAIMIYRVRLVQ